MEPPRPEVTVSDPGRPGPPPDVVGDEPPPVRRRGLIAVVVGALVAGAAVLAVQDVRADRRAAEQERRLASVVDLRLTERVGYREELLYDPATRQATARVVLEVRNGGPRELRLRAAELGDLSFAGDAPVRADGGERVITLEQQLTCPAPGGAPPPLGPGVDGVRLTVVADAGERELQLTPTAVLPLEQVRTVARRACGFFPLEEAVSVTGNAYEASRSEIGLDVTVEHRSVGSVRLSVLDLGGLEIVRLVDSVDGRPVRLPLELAPAVPGEPTVRSLQLTARVADCRRADLEPLGTTSPGALGTITWVADSPDTDVEVGPVSLLERLDVVEAHVRWACGQPG